ncbi:hypothetical protein EIP91_008180 [Steccherinum ochraceum]|uniref:Uncharacterized protein n=1 Tax=Steccherinum ochraceum TaxID=92696 RepID=A0A4R0RGY8_9APHY|nr:hypothetical protein EIP91_008180 [Steccherinum ochraceum]
MLSRVRKPSTSALARSPARRHNSQYHSKVRALPFVATPEEVLERFSIRSSLTLIRDDYNPFPALAHGMLPGLGLGKPFYPTALQPVYIPAWFFDGWVSVGSKEKPKSETSYLGLGSSHIPGFTHPQLTRMAFFDPVRVMTPLVPFTEDLRKQHSLDVLCLPFEFTPTDIPAWLRSVLSRANVEEGLSFLNFSSLQTMLAWYPLLVPIYLLRFDATLMDQQISTTYAVEAYRKEGAYLMDYSQMYTVMASLKDDPANLDVLKRALESTLKKVGSGLMYSKRLDPADFVSVVNHSRTGLDDIAPGGAMVQMLMRQQLNRYAHGSDLWARYKKFWEKMHEVKEGEEGKEGREEQNVRKNFKDARICALDEQAVLDNQFAAAGSFFRSILASKLVAALESPVHEVSSHPFQLPAIKGTMVSSLSPLTPAPVDEPTKPIPEAQITMPLLLSKETLDDVQMPIEVKFVHGAGKDRVVMGRIFVSNLVPPAKETRPVRKGVALGGGKGEKSRPAPTKRTLHVEVRWGETEVDEQASDRMKALMDILATPKLPWIEKWEEENVQVMEAVRVRAEREG